MAIFLGDKYEIHLEYDYICAIKVRDKRKVLHIPKASPYFGQLKMTFIIQF